MPAITRIAYIDPSINMGGAEHLLLTLLDGLPRDQFEPLLLAQKEGMFTEEARRQNLQVELCSLPSFMPQSWQIGARKIINPVAICWNMISSFRAGWKVRGILRREEVDLVQTNSLFAHIYGGLAARLTGVPCIWYFHDLIETRRLGGSIALFWRFLAILLADRVVAVSQAVLSAFAIGSRGVVVYAGKERQHTSLPDFVPLRDRISVPKGARLVIFVGRIAHTKGLDVLALAANNVIQIDPDVHFILVGDTDVGDVPHKQYLDSLVDQFGLAANWHWIGYDANVSCLIADADLLVLPSRREALGLVLVEAGLEKKAAVASRVGGIPEVIIDGETGILVPPEDSSALARAISCLLENPELAARMGQKAYERVERVFDKSRYYQEFLTVYDSL